MPRRSPTHSRCTTCPTSTFGEPTDRTAGPPGMTTTRSPLHVCRRALLAMSALTLAITMLRVVGEVNRWNPTLFAREAGGGGGLVGIGWLMPVCGFWFARSLGSNGDAPLDRKRALGIGAIGLLGVVASFVLGRFVLPVTIGTFVFVLVALAACATAAFAAWPALARVLFVYALLARVPTVAITVVAVANDWGTHYEKPAPGSPPMAEVARTVVLCAAQLGIWIPLTLLTGGFVGALAVRTSRPATAH